MKKIAQNFLIATILVVLSFTVSSCFFSSGSSSQGSGGSSSSSSFSRTLSMEGITFNITANSGELTIRANGLQSSDNMVTRRINGTAYNAEVADLDNDGSPEVMVYTRSGSNNYGEAIVYSVLNRRSMNEVYLPNIRDDYRAGNGYEGEDTFGVTDGFLVRSFPVYQNGRRTNMTREVQYSLVYGENSKIFKVENVRDFNY